MNRCKSFLVKHKKLLTISLCTVLAASITAVGVTAYLTSKPAKAVNTMNIATTSTTIEEKFDGTVKSNVKIKNDGTMSVFIRVKLVPTWQDKNGNPAAKKAALSDLKITWGDNFKDNWIDGSNGYYYYKSKVAPNTETAELIKEAVIADSSKPQLKNYELNLNVLAESIQGDPKEAVKNAWGYNVGADGNLTEGAVK